MEKKKSYCPEVGIKKLSDSIEETFISERRLLQKYNIEIISWDCEEPIENMFE